jgi:hypothetical protein
MIAAGRSSDGGVPGSEARRPSYRAALAAARRIRRRDLALVEQYLAQDRVTASARASREARLASAGRSPPGGKSGSPPAEGPGAEAPQTCPGR